MKIAIEKSASGDARLSAKTLKKAGLAWTDELEAHVSGSAIIVTKKQMSANDLREAMSSLVALATEFKERANEICAECDGEDCPYLEDEGDEEAVEKDGV